MSLTQGSPRLPSPPPPAEIQLSPSLSATASRQIQQMEQTANDANAKRRIHPGTRAEDMAAGPPLVPLNELDSAFQLQEHLAALHYYHTASNTTALTRAAAAQLTQPPPSIDRTLWLYELCRFLIAECNSLIVGFLFDSPPCSSTTCPEMRASEWQFLCAVHDQPKSCCAIDYCCHTLDWAANVVTNPKIFPSRFVLVSDGHDKSAVLKNLINVFRRLHRIFAHAWFQHRDVFWSVESRTGLYAFFKTVCDMYDLLPAENYKLPPEAEGLDLSASSNKDEKRHTVTSIAKPPSHNNDDFEHEDDRNSLHARRSNTARHSSRPSTGSAVTTVIEEGEDEPLEVTGKLKDMHILAPDIAEEESEVEVPVIVEGGISIPADTQAAEPSEHTKDEDHVQPESTSEPPKDTQESEASEDTSSTSQEIVQNPDERTAEESGPTADDADKKTAPEVTDTNPEEATTSVTAESAENAAEPSPENSEEKPTPEDSSTE
ncbi:Mob1/phocein [Xylaria arbuscula]|nr:Mob1/phocein [Xylaria arbuscula]